MKERLMEDLKAAMKNQDKTKLAVIRMVKAAIQMEEIAKQKELDDAELVSIFSKQIKTRKEANVEFEKAGRTDLVDQNNKEIEILNAYMPKMMEESEIESLVKEVFAKVSPTGPNDIGKVMREIAPLVKGKADMSLVNSIIKKNLENL
jgi:hypothetical protein